MNYTVIPYWRKIKRSIKDWWRSLGQKQGKKRGSKIYNPEEIGEDETCIVCYARCKNIIFRKCKHMIVCDRCVNDPVNPIRQCPYCRVNVEDEYIKVMEYEE